MRCGTADGLAGPGSMAPLSTLAVPHKRCGLPVPSLRRLLKPDADLGRAVGMLTGEGAALENALDRLGQIQPAAAQGRIQRQNAVLTQPQHHFWSFVTREIVPDQQQPQRRQGLGSSEAHRQPRLPGVP